MLFTSQSAERKAIITAADEDKPPIGKAPSTTPASPFLIGYYSTNARVAPRK